MFPTRKVNMMNRIFLTLLLSTAVALPGFAQQANSDASAKPAASANQTAPASPTADTDREPLPPTTSTDFWDGDDPNLVNLVTHPFASKKYVQRMTRPIKDRLNELDEITSTNAEKIKDADSRAQHGLQLASEKTNLADQHATDAGNKADTAKLDATQASTRVAAAEQMVSNVDQYKAGAQTEILFRSGQTALSKQAKDALDEMAGPLKDQRSYIIEIRGFAPGRGQASIAASQKMADAVVRYLVLNHQIPVYRIYATAMGNAAATGEATSARHTRTGRVEISLMKNDLLTSAQH